MTILNLHAGDAKCVQVASDIYEKISKVKEVLYDERDITVGKKLADADLIGIPWQIIVGQKKLETGVVELKNRKTGEVIEMSPEEVIRRYCDKN